MKKTITRLLTSLISLLLLLGLLLCQTVQTQAASISISPSSDSVYVGDTITVTVMIYGNKVFAYSGNMNCDNLFSGFTGKFVQDCKGEESVSFTYNYQAATPGTGIISVNGLEVAVDDPEDPEKTIKENPGDAACTITVKEKRTGWFLDNGKWYYANNSGALVKGWLKDKNIWYYLDAATGVMRTGWVKVAGTWYYMNTSGAMQTGWIKDDGIWYYLSASGAMQTGWVKVAGTWYYMNASGAMQTGWILYHDTWYYLKTNGAMASREWVSGYYWLSSNGAWTYQPVGSWKKNATGWWFGDTSGWYAKNETVRIDDVLYQFDDAGYWIR